MDATFPREPRRSGRTLALWLGLLVALGAALRLAFLARQVVGGDEVHVLKVLPGASLADLLTRYHTNDSCIPITAWCWLLTRTVGLDEWGLRLGSWLPGIALVWVVPATTRRWLRAPDRVLLAAALALSPLLVYWSREARPYSAVVLLGWLALCAAELHARRGRTRDLVASAACQFVLFALSPTTAPFLAGLGLASALAGWAQGGGASWRRRARLALARLAPSVLALVLIAALLGPALATLLEIQTTRAVSGNRVGVQTVLHMLRLLFGVPQVEPGQALAPWVAGPAVLLAVGAVSLGRNVPAGRAALLVLALPAVFYALSDFHMVATGVVFLRYQAALVPLYFVATVYGFASLRERLTARSRALENGLLAAAFLGVLGAAVLGPLRGGLPPASPFGMLHSRLFQPASASGRWKLEHASTLYADLAEARPPAVFEWPGSSPEEVVYAFYAGLHGAPIVRTYDPAPRGILEDDPDAGMRLRSFLWDLRSIPKRLPRGSVVVLHRQPVAERAQLRKGRVKKRQQDVRPPPVEAAARKCRELFGAPIHDDEWVLAFRVP